MTNLNATVAYFEDAIRKSDEIIVDCTPALQAELTEQKAHFEAALEALKEAANHDSAHTHIMRRFLRRD